MKIVKVTQDDFNEWLDLALKLWSDESVEEMQRSLTHIFHSPREAGFLVKDDNGTCSRPLVFGQQTSR